MTRAMIQEGELIRLIIGIAASVILAASDSGLQRLPGKRLFTTAFFVLLAGWLFTVIEHFFLEDVFNLLEHLAYLVSGGLYVLWSLNLVRSESRK